MKPTVVIDANILMSVLITKQGQVAATFIEAADRYRFISCHFLYVELFRHKEKLIKLSRLPETDFLDYLLGILNRIEFLSESLIPEEILQQARLLVQDIDPRDINYIALSIHTNAPLWTGDRKLVAGLNAKGFDQFRKTADLAV